MGYGRGLSTLSLAEAEPLLEAAAEAVRGTAMEHCQIGLGTPDPLRPREVCWLVSGDGLDASALDDGLLRRVEGDFPVVLAPRRWVASSVPWWKRAWHRAWCSRGRAVHAGDQIGPLYKHRFGSVGCVVRRGESRMLLTCAHVVAANGVNPGIGDRVKRREHAGREHDLGGVLHTVTIRTGALDNEADCAVVSVGEEHEACRFIPNIGEGVAAPMTDKEIRMGMLVRKMGAATRLTWGRITQFPIQAKVGYKNGQWAGFKTCIEVTPTDEPWRGGRKFVEFCNAGDSGALIVSADDVPRAIGLLTSREVWRHLDAMGSVKDLLGRGVGVPINRVLRLLQASLETGR